MIIPAFPFSSFSIFGLTIHIYAICILTGILTAWIFGKHRIKKVTTKENFDYNLLLIVIVCAIIGARIYHVITYFPQYFNSYTPWYECFLINKGGLAIYGGLISSLLGSFIYCRIQKVSYLSTLDAYAPSILIGQIIGRLGNYVNQELYGSPTNSNSFGLVIESKPGILYHPTFLYEMICNAIALLIILKLDKIWKFRKRGQLFSLYLIFYGWIRSFIELIRINPSNEILGVRVNVWTSILSIIIGTILLVYFQKKPYAKRIELE